MLKRYYIFLLLLLVVGGCSGLGLEKRATLMPDSISLSIGEQSLLPYDIRWRGVLINLTWNFE